MTSSVRCGKKTARNLSERSAMRKMGLAVVAVLLMLWTFTIAAAAAVDSNEYSIVFDEMR